MTPRDISVVIPTLNEQQSIGECISSAKEAGAIEIIVSDGGSSDGTIDVAMRSGATHVIRSVPGRGQQLNAGALFAKGEVVLFLHADNRLAAEALKQICDSSDSIVWGAFRQQILNSRRIYRWLEWGNARRVTIGRLAFGDQAIFVRRELFKKVGGFPEIPLMEDVELSRTLRALHRPTLLDGPVIVSSRRWEQRGVLRQTVINQALRLAHWAGVSPERLAEIYRSKRQHD